MCRAVPSGTEGEASKTVAEPPDPEGLAADRRGCEKSTRQGDVATTHEKESSAEKMTRDSSGSSMLSSRPSHAASSDVTAPISLLALSMAGSLGGDAGRQATHGREVPWCQGAEETQVWPRRRWQRMKGRN